MNTQAPAVHKVRLVQSSDSYGNRWVQPRHEAARFDAEVQLSGSFKHNRHSPFEVTVFDDEQGMADYFGSQYGGPPQGAVGCLRAQATVLTAWKEEKPSRVQVAVGDILETPIGNYEIRDDWPLHDPYLVRVKGELRASKVIREAKVGEALIELYSEAWEDQGGAAGGLMGGRYRLSLSEGGKSVDYGSYVEGSQAIAEWGRMVAFEKARRA